MGVVKKAVVTVPAFFNNAQRQATLDACRIAGLDCQHLIHEPTAAAMAYGLDQNHSEKRNILVFDWGGGTLDVSVLKIENKIFTVLSTNGDTHLGGRDIDEILIEFCIKSQKDKTGKDLSNKRNLIYK